MQSKTYQEIYDAMKNYFIANQDKITDLNQGSVISSIFEAIAREIAAEYVAILTNVDAYQKKIAYAQFDFTKKAGLAATGMVTFTRNLAFSNEIYIPTGTTLATGDGIEFSTMVDTILLAGIITSEPVPVQCKTIGTIGNVAANSITTIKNVIPGLASVTNSADCSGGVDEETDTEFAARFRDYILGLGKSTVPGIKAAVLGINGVKSCSVVEHFPPVDDYNFTIYAENGAGVLPADKKSQIETLIIGDDENPGYKAAGVRARVLAPALYPLTITISASIDWSIPRAYIEGEITAKIGNYINGLGIGEILDFSILSDIVKGQYGILALSNISIAGMPAQFDDSKIVRLASVVTEFV